MRPEARWDRTSDETREDFEGASARGEAAISLCSYGGAAGPMHATVWHAGAPGGGQRFEPDVEPARAPGVIARHARDGFHPALVGMTGPVERPLLAFVLERVAAGAAVPRLVPPRPFRDERGSLFVARAAGDGPLHDGLLRSLAAVGAPIDARGAGLVVAGIWAPGPPVRVAWAVHLDALSAGPWRERWEARTLETIARPVQAIPLASSTGPRWMLSLWHDALLEPWPAPDPFAAARRFEADEEQGSPALERAVARRRALEDRRVLSLGAGDGPGGTRFVALYGSRGTEATLARRFFALAPGDEAPGDEAPGPSPATVALEAGSNGEPEHPLDRWALDHMRETGARHGQLVVVRRRRLAFARAYTFAEAGYPVARLDDAMRLGSVSKALTTIALLAQIDRRGLPGGVDARVTGTELLDLAAGVGPPSLAAVTLRHLLTHDAGLKTFVDVRPDDPANPLSEHRLTALLSGAAGAARPGQLAGALALLRDDGAFARAPGGAARLDYSNQGFILLGEILARLSRGRFDAYEAAVVDALLRRAGVEPGERGCLLGAGRRRARARREAPAHPSSPTWAAKRFEGDDLDEGPLVLAPYADNGPFLGGAAGWCVPLVWLARVLAALGPRADGSGLWQRAHADLAATPAAPGSYQGHGFHVGAPGWWTFRPSAGAPAGPLTLRVIRLHHSGRVEGGAALLVHQIPIDPRDDALDGTLSLAVAFNVLGPLQHEPHGTQLLAILRGLEGSPGWDTQDLFERVR